MRSVLTAALRGGDWRAVLAGIGGEPAGARIKFRRAIAPVADAILAAPIGERDPEERWAGPLTLGHHRAAVAALLATASLPQAKRFPSLDATVAREAGPLLFPEDLDDLAEAWTERFRTNPKAWDRNRGIHVVFDWVQAGLIRPPTNPGAVLLLICWTPGAERADTLLRYLLARPKLITTTLPALFEISGIKGASAAQRDGTHDIGRGLGNFVIPELIRLGYWDRDRVLAWCDVALRVPRSEYEYRWFRTLRASLD